MYDDDSSSEDSFMKMYSSQYTNQYTHTTVEEVDERRDQEKEIMTLIKDSKFENLKEDFDYYLLSLSWFKKWENYLKSNRMPRPSSIDNTKLVDRLGDLRSTISERFDYMIVSEEIWNKLMEVYGGDDVIVISRPCKKSSLGKLFIEVKKLTIKIIRSSDLDKSYSTEASKTSNLSEFVDIIINSFECKKDDIRLWLYSSGKRYKRLKYLNKRLDQLGIYSGQTVLLEERKENGKWPSTNFYKKSARTNTRMYHAPTESGKTGLVNLGNTCFMNSALQCLSSVAPLTDFFLSMQYRNDLNRQNPLSTGGLLAEEYQKVLTGLWSSTTGVVEPYDFKRTLSRFAEQFSGYNQHDSQELLIYLLDKIHEDINRVTDKPYVEVKESDGRDDYIVAAEAWEGHKKRDNSKIVDLFHGQLKSTVTCPDCGKKSITFDPFMYLPVPVPGRDNSSDRNITVTLFRKDPIIKPMRFSLKASDYETVYSLKKQLVEFTDISDPNHVIFLDCYESTFFAEFASKQRVRDIRKDDIVFAFEHCEYHESDSSDSEEIQEYELRIMTYHMIQENEVDFFGSPLLISVKNNSTYETLYQEILRHINRFLKESATTTEDLDKWNNDAQLFEMIPMNMEGKVLNIEFSREGPLPLEDALTIGLVWTEENFEKFYDLEKDKFFDAHSSFEISQTAKLGGVDLYDCLSSFVKEEQLGKLDTWYCNQCKDHMQAFKKLDLWTLPPILILHLKRFSDVGGMWRSKLDTKIDYPIDDLDLSTFLIPSDENHLYELIAVSNHFGSMGGGHYTAYMKHRNGGWYECDDSHVSPLHSSPVTSSGYVLFYKRKNFIFENFTPKEEEMTKEESSSDSGSEGSENPTFQEKEPDPYADRIKRNMYMPLSDSDDSSDYL